MKKVDILQENNVEENVYYVTVRIAKDGVKKVITQDCFYNFDVEDCLDFGIIYAKVKTEMDYLDIDESSWLIVNVKIQKLRKLSKPKKTK